MLVVDLPEPRVDPDAVRARADDILEGKEFRREESAIGSGVEWILRQLGRFFGTLFGGGGGGGGFVVGLVVLALVAALLFLLLRHRPRRRVREPRRAEVQVEHEERTSTDWGGTAADHEARGEWRLALRARYRELLASLYERRLLADLAGRTAGEYRRELAEAAPAAAAAFASVTDHFERAWYSEADVGPDELSEFRRAAASTLTAVAGP
jgi:hypothetical protein